MNRPYFNNICTTYDVGPIEDRPPKLLTCAGCGEEVCDGDDYYELIEGDYCLECIENFRRTARE